MKISIITAAYNSGWCIGDTLDSVAAQSYADIEHIIVDGLSKDDTLDVVRQRGGHIARVVSEKDRGIYDAYNKGLGLVCGDVIGFLNSDDFYCAPDVISNVARLFEDESIDAVHADLVYVDRDDTSVITRHWRSHPLTMRRLAQGFVPAHPTLFLRRSVYERCGNFDVSYRLAADFEFMFRIFHKHRVQSHYLPRVLVKMRNGGATGESFASIRRQNDEIVKAMAIHGVHVSPLMFYGRKLIDRSVQRVRARISGSALSMGDR